MGALLPAPRTQPYHACDFEDDGFLNASDAPGGEAPVFDHWRDAENDAITAENESFVPLPLSREPRFSEEPVPSSTDVEDKMAEGEFLTQELGHESLVLVNREQEEEGTTMEDIGYITMEAPPRGSDVFRSSVPVLHDEDNMVQRLIEAPLTAKESVQELSVSDNEDRTEDGKFKDMEEMESFKENMSLGVDIIELSDMPVLVLRDEAHEGIVVERGDGEKFSFRESDQDSHLTDIEDKIEGNKTKEEIPLQEAKPSVLDDTMLERKIEGDVTVEMVVKEVFINTDPFTGEVAGEQVDSIATALPDSESLQASNLVTQELQAMVEVANIDDAINAALTEDVVLDIGDTGAEGMEHYGEAGISSVASVVTVDDIAELVSSRSPAVSGISDDMTGVKSRPDADRSNQTTGYTPRNKEFLEKEATEDKHVKTEENKTMDDKVPTRSMPPQITDVSKSPVPVDKTKIEDEVTVEMMLEEMTSNAEDLVTREVVAVQLNIVDSESESPSVSDHVAQELRAVSEAAVVDEIRGSTVIEDIKNEFSDITTEVVEHHSDRGTCSFVSGVPEVTVDHGKDLVLSRSTPHAPTCDSASSVDGMPVFDNPHQTTGVEYKPVNEGFRRNDVAEDMDNYTEEQLREQLDTLRTITGYRPTPSLTLEAELVGLYIFVGVEPPVSSRDESDLNDLNTKLRFLKSIIGVE
ncbi:hypothetical protein SORBI_3003G372600 [Sorghum bicolor]|nr:hypothetical protein SORBI_3003G372600 [Sorghum bicolor]